MPHAVDSEASSADILHVFDLPQLHTRPSGADILGTLDLLKYQAPSWDRSAKLTIVKSTRPQVAPEGVAQYLTSIIASQLRWIRDDEQKEMIWEEASLRLAERSGRSAMPAMSRSFTIPLHGGKFDLALHEPALTGDSLGFKTWAASFLLAKRLHTMNLPLSMRRGEQLRALELGAGTGLVGMALAAVHEASVLLTDLPEIEGNLARNVRQNAAVIEKYGGSAQTAVLDWTNPTAISLSASSASTSGTESICTAEKFPLIVAADSIYSAEHPPMLVSAIETWLSPSPDAWVIMEMPRREGYSAELEDLKQRMLSIGLEMLCEDEETGYDDWSGSDDELQEVNCWFSVWRWATT